VAGVRTVKTKLREPGSAAFSALMDVSPTTTKPRGNVRLAIDAHGRAVVAWSESSSIGETDAMGATRDAGAAGFGDEVPLNNLVDTTSPSSISTDGDGNTLVAVFKTNGARAAKVTPFDAAGPLLNGLSIPAAGNVGDALPFSVSPIDAWSPLGATSWAFGDGGAGAGASTVHAYGAPGAHSVTVSSTDALGNSSEATGSTTISAVPGAGSPDLTELKLSSKKFRAAGGATAGASAKKPPVGAKVSYRLSEAAQVKFTVRPKKGKARKSAAKGATRKGSLTKSGKSGTNSFKFNGKLKGRPLAPGKYTLEAVATDADGNRSKPRTVAFTVVAG
jgi:hypothetical protein